MANNQNLKPFKKGRSGNPGGRPKGASVSARLLKLLLEDWPRPNPEVQIGPDGKPIPPPPRPLADQIAETIVINALSGDHKFVKELLDRTEGKVPDKQQIELSKLSDAELIERVAGTPSGGGKAGD